MTVDVDIIEQQTPGLDEFPPQVEADGRPPEASCDVESKMKVRSSMEKKADALGAKRGPRFIIAHTWPKLHNAEYEVLQRLSRAATNIGATMIAVDNEGHPLWANNEIPLDTSKPIDSAEIDFMISLHF